MTGPCCSVDDFREGCSLGAAQHVDDERLLRALTCLALGRDGLRSGFPNLGLLGLYLQADRCKPRVADDQGVAMTLAGLSPDGVTQLPIGLHFVKETLLD